MPKQIPVMRVVEDLVFALLEGAVAATDAQIFEEAPPRRRRGRAPRAPRRPKKLTATTVRPDDTVNQGDWIPCGNGVEYLPPRK